MNPPTAPGLDDPVRLAEELALARDALGASRDVARRAEQRLSLALQAFDSVVWEMDYRQRRVFLTGAVASIFDRPPTFEAFAADPLCICHADDRARIGELWFAHLQDGRPLRAEHRIARHDGAEIWVEIAAETLRAEDGSPERIIGVVKNITGKKLDQLAMDHAREAAEAANRAKTEFLANMSHELRTPLNGVLGIAGVLSSTSLAPDQRDMVALIESSARTLERLLADVLDLARVEAGRLTIHADAFDLGALTRDLCALFQAEAQPKGVAVLLEIEPRCAGWFTGDIARLRQILTNLMSNAVKFTGAGAVKLSVEMEDGGVLRFIVSDTGPGFEPEEAERLFDRFHQADGSATRGHGGAGLGLSISRALARRMGGDLTALGEPGRGASFTLALSLATAADPRAAAAGPARGALVEAFGRRPVILVAEDHPTNRKVVELILGAAGAELVHVGDGAEALRLVGEQTFDLVLMDLQMPVMDGLTAIRAIRARERQLGLGRLPIVALTAHAMAEHSRASHEAGADDHVTKPVSAQTLLASVIKALAPPQAPPAAVGF